MTQLPIGLLSPEQQQRILGQLYQLMGIQVQSYHRHRHMGTNSSVPMELAQDLMESIEYTLGLVGGLSAHSDIREGLILGQEILETKVKKARAMLELVDAAAPRWQTECRWEAIRCLRHYLDQYDHLHLAHKGPEALFCPILISPPEGIQGIDLCLFYLGILWIEDQIMAGVPEGALEAFWDRLPAATLDQCEQLLINGIGKALLGTGLDPLTFSPEEYPQLLTALSNAAEEQLYSAAARLCQWLGLRDEDACMYVRAVIPVLSMWTGENARKADLESIFL